MSGLPPPGPGCAARAARDEEIEGLRAQVAELRPGRLDGNHFDLRNLLYVWMDQGRMADVWVVPLDQAQNDRYLTVQSGALARRAAAPS